MVIRWQHSGGEDIDGSEDREVGPWTKEDVRKLKTVAREKTRTIVIARKLKRTLGATYAKANALGVSVGITRREKKAR